jgi:TRAP-type C4-dicarboxylate transport system substrate-binding protein
VRRALLALALSAATLLAVAPTRAAEGAIVLNLGSVAPKGTPWSDSLAEIEKQVETASGGRIDVVVRTLGNQSEVDIARDVRSGKLQAAAVTTAALSEGAEVPLLQVVELPFLFADDAAADKALEGVFRDAVAPKLAEKNLVLTAISENGWRSFATRSKPIHEPKDLVGLKMRAQEAKVHVAAYEAFGATAVQTSTADLAKALQSGSVDGLDNTPLYVQAAGLAESIRYFTLSRHVYQPAVVVVSKSFYDGLPADLRPAVDGIRELGPKSRAAIRAEEAKLMENFALFGVEVVELTPAQREAFATKAKAMHTSFAATIEGGPALLEAIRKVK